MQAPFLHVLDAIPGLDSIIRGEGEEPLLELYRNIGDRRSWGTIDNLAFRSGSRIVANPCRPLNTDLDALPFPACSPDLPNVRGIGMCSLAGSRGCFFDCSFCSIRRFYSEASGPPRRTRSPGNVVAEIEQLFHERGIRIFIFEDDDFVMRTATQKRWIAEFIAGLRQARLADEIMWRVSCRVDEVDAATLRMMADAGLACVYLGIESGSDVGLRTFNKHYSVDHVRRSVHEIQRAGIPYEFGFMVLHPETTFATVRQDIELLKQITARGDAVVHFTKMLPYAGTAIAQRLAEQGRLTGGMDAPDYCFNDPRLDLLQVFLSQAFHHRNFDASGLVERLRYAKLDALTLARFFPDQCDHEAYLAGLYSLIREANAVCLEKMSMAVRLMQDRSEDEILGHWWLLDKLVHEERDCEHRIVAELDRLMAFHGSGISRPPPPVPAASITPTPA